MSRDSNALQLTSRIQARAVQPIDVESLRALILERAPDPSAIERRELAFWDAEISNNEIDYYGTQMDVDTTLPNFVTALENGISYQDSHDTYKLGWGQSIRGRLETTDDTVEVTGEKRVRVVGTFYTALGMNLAGQSTTDFYDAISLGVWRDVSVGITTNEVRCSICGQSMMGALWDEGECLHIPGMEYAAENGRKLLAYGIIVRGELHEVSQVYDGATPNAAVLKATQMADAGVLDRSMAAKLEQKYQVRFTVPGATFAVPAGVPLLSRESFAELVRGSATITKTKNRKESTVPEDTAKRITKFDDATWDLIREITIADPDAVIGTTEDGTEVTAGALLAALVDDEMETEETERTIAEIDAAIETTGVERRSPDETLSTLVKRVREGVASKIEELNRSIAELTPLAADGRTYREDLTEETLELGTRAFGETWDRSEYETVFRTAPISFIRRMHKDWTSIGDAKFGVDDEHPGGRRTRDVATRKRREDDDYNPEAHKA